MLKAIVSILTGMKYALAVFIISGVVAIAVSPKLFGFIFISGATLITIKVVVGLTFLATSLLRARVVKSVDFIWNVK